MICYRLPDQWPIDAEVPMHQKIAQPCNILPWHVAGPRLPFSTQPRDRFAHRRSPLCHRVTECLILSHRARKSASVLLETALAIQSRASKMSLRRWASRRIDQAGFGEHTGADQRLQCRFDRKIDRPAEEVRQFACQG